MPPTENTGTQPPRPDTWPPHGYELIDSDSITQALVGYNITNAATVGATTVLELQGRDLPDITLTVQGGQWTATVQ